MPLSASFILNTIVAYQLTTEPPFAETWKRIRAFAALEPGWKGPDSKPVPQKAIDDAERFAMAVMTSDTLPPDLVGAASDGELMITWHAPNLFVDVGFHGDGTYSVFADIAGQKILLDDVPASQSLPPVVLTALQIKKDPQR